MLSFIKLFEGLCFRASPEILNFCDIIYGLPLKSVSIDLIESSKKPSLNYSLSAYSVFMYRYEKLSHFHKYILNLCNEIDINIKIIQHMARIIFDPKSME